MQTTIPYIENQLAGLYPSSEIKAFVRIILQHIYGISYTEMILKPDRKLDEVKKYRMIEVVERLKKFEPIQYILGETEFFELRLLVEQDVLIPRPETEELVQWILESGVRQDAVIFDIGTGSGCIAIALKSRLSNAKVTAVDVSEKALRVASKNAGLNQLSINFIQADMLNWEKYSWPEADLVVSNPPYVRESEQAQMNANVLDYEPGLALFVPDEDPLVFYRAIATFALKYLKNGGLLFFEINENMGTEMLDLIRRLGFVSVEIKKDMNGRNRMMRCRKPFTD